MDFVRISFISDNTDKLENDEIKSIVINVTEIENISEFADGSATIYLKNGHNVPLDSKQYEDLQHCIPIRVRTEK